MPANPRRRRGGMIPLSHLLPIRSPLSKSAFIQGIRKRLWKSITRKSIWVLTLKIKRSCRSLWMFWTIRKNRLDNWLRKPTLKTVLQLNLNLLFKPLFHLIISNPSKKSEIKSQPLMLQSNNLVMLFLPPFQFLFLQSKWSLLPSKWKTHQKI